MPETTIDLDVSAEMPMNREIGKKLKDCKKKITLWCIEYNYNKQRHDAKLAIFRITTLLVLHHDVACSFRHVRFRSKWNMLEV